MSFSRQTSGASPGHLRDSRAASRGPSVSMRPGRVPVGLEPLGFRVMSSCRRLIRQAFPSKTDDQSSCQFWTRPWSSPSEKDPFDDGSAMVVTELTLHSEESWISAGGFSQPFGDRVCWDVMVFRPFGLGCNLESPSESCPSSPGKELI